MWSPLGGLAQSVSQCCTMMMGSNMSAILRLSWQPQTMSVRTRFKGARMRRDFKRRKLVEEFYPERMRINCIRHNTILPVEIKEIADKEIDAYPRDTSFVRIHKRCIITSRPRGLVTRWRVSRFVFREQSDYNFMSGVIRAKW